MKKLLSSLLLLSSLASFSQGMVLPGTVLHFSDTVWIESISERLRNIRTAKACAAAIEGLQEGEHRLLSRINKKDSIIQLNRALIYHYQTLYKKF